MPNTSISSVMGDCQHDDDDGGAGSIVKKDDASLRMPYDYLCPQGLDPARALFATAKPGSGRANLSHGLPGWYTEINPLWEGMFIKLLLFPF